MALRDYFNSSTHQDLPVFYGLLDSLSERNDIFSCVSHVKEGSYHCVSPSFESLVGYPAEFLERKGVNFFTELAHREDVLKVIEQEAEAFQKVFQPGYDPSQPNFTELDARVLQKDGSYIRFWALVMVLEFFSDGTFKTALVAGFVPSGDGKKNAETSAELKSTFTKVKNFHRSIYSPAWPYELTQAPLTEIFNFRNAPHLLTLKEQEVLRGIANGLSSKELADQLGISDNTVETHRKNMFLKFNVNNAAELIAVTSKLYWLP